MTALQQLEDQLKKSGARRENRVWFYNRIEPGEFEKQYLAIRKREGRIYSDSRLRTLPEVLPDHPLAEEWAIRAASLERFQRYLAALSKKPRLLDIGCGNGWMTRHITPYTDFTVGVEINSFELKQAARVFHELNDDLLWLYGDVFDDILPEATFDCILLASSVQYFPNLTNLFKRAADFLVEGGEIHIVDTPFYSAEDLADAKQRSLDYYTSTGFPNLADSFNHFSISEIESFSPESLYNPRSFRKRLKKRLLGNPDSPFPWYKIKKQDL